MSQTTKARTSTARTSTGAKSATRKPLGTSISSMRRLARAKRHVRIRKKVNGTARRPRLVVTRSTRHIVAQIVDDTAGHTLASASTMEADLRTFDGDKKAKAARVGALVAARAKEAGVGSVVFDRGGNAYHGRIAALADAARDGGLEF